MTRVGDEVDEHLRKLGPNTEYRTHVGREFALDLNGRAGNGMFAKKDERLIDDGVDGDRRRGFDSRALITTRLSRVTITRRAR